MRGENVDEHGKNSLLTPPTLGAAIRMIICLYGVFLSSVFPLIYRNNYIDINTFKFLVFSTATGLCFAFFCAYLVLRLILIKRSPLVRCENRPRAADAAMLLFLLVNALSCALSENPQLSCLGLSGRKTGLQFILCLSAMYLMLRCAPEALSCVKVGLTISGALCSLLAIINFLGFDPLDMYSNLVPGQHEMFISTIGNRNFYGAFMCIFLPVSSSICVFGEGKRSLLCWPCVLLGFAAVVSGRSDLAYAGVGAATLVLFFLSLRSARAFSKFMLLTCTAALSVLILRSLYGVYAAQSLYMYPSISKWLLTSAKIEYALGALLFAALAGAIFVVRLKSERALRVIRRAALATVVSLAACVLVLMLFYTLSGKTPPFASDLLKFDDDFGNFRGYIWIRAVRIFKDLSPVKKLIGLGPDMFKSYAQRIYKAEMNEITGAAFDNCHNEYLQYLLTSGLLGLFAYVTALAASFITLIRRVKANDLAFAPLLTALTGYAVQSLFNVNQPMTTPFVFLIMALSFGQFTDPRNQS